MAPTEGFQPTLSKLAALLDRLGIRFHVTGGLTSVAYGEPRLTQDIDLVRSGTSSCARSQKAGFHFSEAAARRAIESRRMFQVLDSDQVIKVDLYLRCLVPGELDRSVRTELFAGLEVPIVARTDAALSKLIWIHHGNHRSRRDLRRILAEAEPGELDLVRRTAGEMNLSELLDEVLAESDDIDI